MSARFGPSGSSDSFFAQGYSSSTDMPGYLARMGLDAFEYQCGHGVNIRQETAALLGERAAAAGIRLSLHAPYYISLSSPEAEKRERSVSYILTAAQAAHWMGADRVVLHPGSTGKRDRAEAMALARNTFRAALAALDANGLGGISLCPETMGKLNQLGDLDEILTFCAIDERVIPCLDFGHLNARTHGGLATEEDYEQLYRRLENALGQERARHFHAHFSKIEYSAGGEVRHLTFADRQYGPDFEPLMRVLVRHGAEPSILCESAGTQAEDALAMQACYRAEAALGRKSLNIAKKA